jgi:uncharacterized membrane protein YcaP (DUF421 family)
MNPYIMIIISSVTVYLFIVLAIRLFGKNELSQLSIVDLVFILLISNSVQNAMVGTNSTLLGGLVAATSLFTINWLLRNLLFKNKKINQFIQGSALMLIYKGKVIQKHLDQANISIEELAAAVREHGVKDIKNVDLAVLEVDGNISVLSRNFTKITLRKRIPHRMFNKSG